jgi:hypothetical protein
MESKHSFKKRLLGASAGAAAIALAAGGVAMASTPSATKPAATKTASAAASTSSAKAHITKGELRRLTWLARHTVHANLIVDTAHGYKTVDIDRGALTTATSTGISIVRPDGPTVSATITSSTKFRGIPESQLANGDRVVLVQSHGDALVVWAAPPASTTGS